MAIWFLVTPSGWMNSEIFLEVFKYFIKHMNRDHMMEGAPNGNLVLVTPSGWMSSKLFPEAYERFKEQSSRDCHVQP